MQTDRELELEGELELSLLQIKQLQEELEHCYSEHSGLKGRKVEYSPPPPSSLNSAQLLITESRVNDSGYSESRFYAKRKPLLSQVSQLKQALESSTNEKAELESELEILRSEIAMLEKQISDTAAERDREAHEYQENKKRAEKLQCQVEQLAADLKESSRSVVSGQKKLTKFQADLGRLRDSYAEKVASEQELVELVNQLREKLTLASRYYFDLQKEHPEILLPIKDT